MDQNQPKNYLVGSILATIFCCQPFGIVSIVYASQVNSKFAAGDYEGAQKASKKAKSWLMWAVISGLVVGVVFLLIYGSIFAALISEGKF
ncbi:MAG: CD225/dispanin family protein [Lutibacter sp.]|uniref:CD225/dispanin family protein n=1 Tax=Lutibacter sp. TaxID=1925666 RepID=UPI00385EE081